MQEVLKLQEMNMKQKLSFRKKKISENERRGKSQENWTFRSNSKTLHTLNKMRETSG